MKKSDIIITHQNNVSILPIDAPIERFAGYTGSQKTIHVYIHFDYVQQVTEAMWEVFSNYTVCAGMFYGDVEDE